MVLNVPIYGPRWFNGIDSLFEVVFILAALSVWWYARKIKCLTGDKSCSTLGQAFLLIAIAFAIKGLTNLVVFMKLDDLGGVVWFSQVFQIQVLLAFGYFLFRLFFLVALIWLVCLHLKVSDWRVRALFVMFAAVGTFFSQYSYVVFHLIALILLIYVVAGAYEVFKEIRNRRTAIITMSFLAILAGHVAFLFVGMEGGMYVLGESLELAGFLGILYNQMSLPRVGAHSCGPSSQPARVIVGSGKTKGGPKGKQ